MADVVGIGPHHLFDLPALEKLKRVLLEMQDDGRAARRLLGGNHRKGAQSFRSPGEGLPASGLARGDLDPVCHDEGRVEADPELADEIDPLARLFDKGLGSGPGDRAQIVDEFRLAHADAAVGNGQRLGGLVGRDDDIELGRIFQQGGLGNGLIAQLVQRIGGIGNEFAQEHIPVRIDRMHHEVQEFGHFRLELVGFCLGFLRRFRHLVLVNQTAILGPERLWSSPPIKKAAG